MNDDLSPWAQMMRSVSAQTQAPNCLIGICSTLEFDLLTCCFSIRNREAVSPLAVSTSGPSTSQHLGSERLVKQTYSVLVSLPTDRPRSIVRKWHLSKEFFDH